MHRILFSDCRFGSALSSSSNFLDLKDNALQSHGHRLTPSSKCCISNFHMSCWCSSSEALTDPGTHGNKIDR